MAVGRRAQRRGPSPLFIGLLAVLIIAIGTYLGFTKDIPFTTPFEVKGVFPSANSIRLNSPVRIAGVNVGKVKKVEPQAGTDAAIVTMQISKQGLPIHKDATAKIRPRIFLEGNFFVDLRPGTPSSPTVDDGYTLQVTQTSTPVQLDQVLTALQDDTRQDLKDVLDGLGTALNAEPTAEEDRGVDPSTRGQTGAESFNDNYDDAGIALRATSQVNEALLGEQPDADLQRLIRGTSRATAGLARNEEQLKDLITNFNGTMASLASEDSNLRASIRELAPTLRAADGALDSLNAAFPPTRAFAREILPGVRETPATIQASFPWIAQTRKLVSRAELGGLVRDLSPATRDLAKVTDAARDFLPETDLLSRCATDVILPTGDVVIKDEFTTGAPNYREFFYALVGLSGESQNFDGNGQYVRFQPGGGSQTISLGSASSATGQLFGNAGVAPVGTRPRHPGRRSAYKPDATCYKNEPPDLNGPAAARGPADATRPAGTAARKRGTP